jgi:hypothetical protein
MHDDDVAILEELEALEALYPEGLTVVCGVEAGAAAIAAAAVSLSGSGQGDRDGGGERGDGHRAGDNDDDAVSAPPPSFTKVAPKP